MPSFNQITAQSNIPVANTTVTFEPVRIDGPLASYAGVVAPGGVPPAEGVAAALEPTLTISLKKPSKTSRISTARLRIALPRAVIVEGKFTNAKDREVIVDISIVSSERALPAERKQALEVLQSVLAFSDVEAVLIDNKTIY